MTEFQIKRRDLQAAIAVLLGNQEIGFQAFIQFNKVADDAPRINRLFGDDILKYEYIIDSIQNLIPGLWNHNVQIISRATSITILDLIVKLLDPETDSPGV